MTYALALKLKNAGYPQDTKSVLYHPTHGILIGIPSAETLIEPEVVAMPDLSDLIAKCGDKFHRLSRINPYRFADGYGWEEHYIATGNDIMYFSTTRDQEYKGSTPEEAVSKMWLDIEAWKNRKNQKTKQQVIMNHETTIKRIQELVPDVMKLEFGCEVIDNMDIVSRILQVIPKTRDRQEVRTEHCIEYVDDITILGKPITLSVVMLAIGDNQGRITVDTVGHISAFNMVTGTWTCYGIWNLSKDNFNDQSDETKAYIGEVLFLNSQKKGI